MEFIVYIIVFAFAYLGVEFFRRWSLRRKLFDVPNERSSHTTPTPRGGGLVIVLICLTVYSIYTIFFAGNFQWSYLVGASLIALISWLDDLYTISFVWRFLTHSSAALLVIFALGSFDVVYLPILQNINIGLTGALLTFLWIVWLTNAYNFMDGIDGIAGTQAVTAGLGWLATGKILGFEITGFYGGVIAFASLAFLIQNWQPAKVFMGDVGSAFLGYSFAVLPLLAKNEIVGKSENRAMLPMIAVLLVWLFVFDTVWTFLRRIVNGEKVWLAHRGHIYQKMVINGLSHQFVTVLYGIMSLLTALILIWDVMRNGEVDIILLALVAFQSALMVIYTFSIKKETQIGN